MATITYRCRDCSAQFPNRSLSDAHIAETLANSKSADSTGSGARSHTIVTVRPTSDVSPWSDDIAAMFDNMVILSSGDTVRAYVAGEWS